MPNEPLLPTFSDAWRQRPARLHPEPKWLLSLTHVPGIVINDGVVWPESEERHQVRPQAMNLDGRSYTVWPGGSSPVKQWYAEELRNDWPLSKLVGELVRVLCRAGEPSDYHFAIQDACTIAFARRADDPDALAWTEWLCWLNLRLIDALPSAIRFPGADGDNFVRVLAFKTLAIVYESEGMLELARDVVMRARDVRNTLPVEDLDERLLQLRAEDKA